MPHHAVFLKQIVEQAAHSHALQILDVHEYRLRAAETIAPRHLRRNDLVAGNDPVDRVCAACVR